MPERKVMFRQNPNIEIRNPKQIRIPNNKMTKTNTLEISCFEFRIFDRKQGVFVQAIVRDFSRPLD